MNFIELFNELIKLAKTDGRDEIPTATSLDDNAADIGLDSLDLVLIAMFLGELYGLDDEASRDIPLTTLGDTVEFLHRHKTQEVTSIKDAIKAVK